MLNSIEAPRGPNDLFSNRDQARRAENPALLEAEVRVLPLGPFSEFILTEQPRLLTAIRAGSFGAGVLVQRQREILASLDPEIVDRAIANPFLARIAMLDLTFSINAAVLAENPPSGSRPSDEVEQLNARFAHVTGQPRAMTFEKIVGVNSKLPYQQIRTFTDGEVGATERMFYYSHALMDTLLQDTTRTAANAVSILANGQSTEETIEDLSHSAKKMQEFSDFMMAFMRMPHEHFTVFRQYLSQYPDRTRNASGAFIGMPRLNLRLMGSMPFYEDFLNEGMQYFPVTEQQDIQQARRDAQQGNYLVAICERLEDHEGKNLAKKVKELIEPLHQFRLTHFAAVIKYLPPQAIPEGGKNLKAQLEEPYESILEDKPGIVRGTGGFLPGPLLRNMLRLDLHSLQRLETILNEKDSP